MAEAIISDVAHSDPKWIPAPIKDSKGKESFSADDVIEAYFKGRKDEEAKNYIVLMEKFESNLNAAKESCEKMYKYIKSSSFACDGMHLKFKDLYTFDALFVIPEADWCRDEFDSIYEKADEIIDAVKQETFMLSLIFMPKTSEMNMLAIRSDGFRFSYLPSK